MPAAPDATWPADTIATLRTLWLDGISARAIGARLGRTRSSILGKISRLGLVGQQPRKLRAVAPRQRPRRKARPARTHVWQPRPQNIRPQRPEPVADLAHAPAPRLLAVHELAPSECHWPYGDQPILFCGAESFGLVYCPYHARMARRVERVAS